MKKKNQKRVIGLTEVGLFIVILIVVWLFWKNYKLKNQVAKVTEENDRLILNNHDLLSANAQVYNAYQQQTEWANELYKRLDKPDDFAQRIMSQLNQLAEEFKSYPQVRTEIEKARKLVRIDEESLSLAHCTKIIEALLKQEFNDNDEFKQKYCMDKKGHEKKPNLGNCIEFAFEKGVITDADKEVLKLLKDNRNTEFHELATEKERDKLIHCWNKIPAMLQKLSQKFTFPQPSPIEPSFC